MKSLLKYSLAVLAGALVFTACDKNDPPKFDDANAFVAFSNATAYIDESVLQDDGTYAPTGGVLKLPVTLASVKGLEESVRFTVKDGTAKAGVNYRLLTTSGTLSFNAENRTQNIEIEVLYYPEYTGDLRFTVELDQPESIKLGATASCTVTVGDVDHPLSALLGSYSVVSTGSNKSWSMTLYKDDSDDHMVWFFNIFANAGWAINSTMFYGNVNDDLTNINIPLGQKTQYTYSNGNAVELYALDADDNEYTSGSIDVTIVKDADGNVTGLDFGDRGVWAYIPDAGTVGYAYPVITATKD